MEKTVLSCGSASATVCYHTCTECGIEYNDTFPLDGLCPACEQALRESMKPQIITMKHVAFVHTCQWCGKEFRDDYPVSVVCNECWAEDVRQQCEFDAQDEMLADMRREEHG